MASSLAAGTTSTHPAISHATVGYPSPTGTSDKVALPAGVGNLNSPSWFMDNIAVIIIIAAALIVLNIIFCFVWCLFRKCRKPHRHGDA